MADEPTKIILGDTAISAIEEPGRRRFFGRRKTQKPPLTHCENCGTELTGRFCAQCGQAAIDYHRSFGQVLADVLDSFLNWDSKFFHTIALLITRPWRLTNEFLGGRRVRYVHPARLYLLASILFFLAVTYWAKSVKLDLPNLSSEQKAELRDELRREDIPLGAREKIEKALKLEERTPTQSATPAPTEPGTPPAPTEPAHPPAPPTGEATEASPKPPEKERKFLEFGNDSEPPANEFERWIETQAKEKLGEHGSKAQLFFMTLVRNLPYMVLCCIPLFALVLKILYIRKGIFYIDHLVYALHIHTFAYVAIMLIILTTMGLNRIAPNVAGWVIGILWITFAVQIFLSIRRVYRQGWFFTIFKFFVGGFAYLIVLLGALFATFLITLLLPF